MSLTVINKNILDVTEGVIAHGCNAQGVMGSGVAKQLRARYPDIFKEYITKLSFYDYPASMGQVIWCDDVRTNLSIANCITQKYYGKDGSKFVSYDALHNCMLRLSVVPPTTPIYMPYLIGAGLGGGSPEVILAIIESTIAKTHDVYLCKL